MDWHAVPDLEAGRMARRDWAMKPGDPMAFDARALHSRILYGAPTGRN